MNAMIKGAQVMKRCVRCKKIKPMRNSRQGVCIECGLKSYWMHD